jgi:hypothetical protein
MTLLLRMDLIRGHSCYHKALSLGALTLNPQIWPLEGLDREKVPQLQSRLYCTDRHRAAERYNDITDEERARRRARGWDLVRAPLLRRELC